MSRTIIELEDIFKRFYIGTPNELEVLHGISLKVMEGEFVAIVGASGSGKSTLMNIIGALDRPTEGKYILDGVDMIAAKDAELSKIRNRKIGFVFQNYHLIPAYTVLQNVIMPLLMRGIDHKTAEDMCMDTIRLLGLGERLHHKPNELSGGQKQRVAIARALVGKPAILLADEPSGALDSKMGKEVLRLFGELNAMGNTIVMITHDLEVAKAAQRVVRIVDGKLYHKEEQEATG